MSDDTTDLIDRVQAAVLAVPGVADLHGGVFGEAGTYLPGRKVAGIRLRDDVAEIHVTLRHGPSVPETADRVRHAVASLVDTPVHVLVEDLVGPEDGDGPERDVDTASHEDPDTASASASNSTTPHPSRTTTPDGEHS